ncbi:hypothetical protein SI859A1_02303 [Aurantimonas manganoxydans SI85-9A1]|uniref:Uncharacterized protein n=2 Tax=Aurantimonas manganoxydans TaxID=651183 RepID=Q1YM94_AURMS|nr:hypothetical protein SI859A1_02303 [Aurantimonas manganoxydans SI85-9A1]
MADARSSRVPVSIGAALAHLIIPDTSSADRHRGRGGTAMPRTSKLGTSKPDGRHSQQAKEEPRAASTPEARVQSLALDIVAKAAAAAASPTVEDPCFGAWTPLQAFGLSVTTRVGQALPGVIAIGLEADPRLKVLQETRLPITATALSIGDQETARNVVLGDEERPVRYLAVDLIVIDRTTGHATLLDVKRGSALYSSRARLDLCTAMAACSLTAPAALRRVKVSIASASWGIIDLAGAAGFAKDRSVSGAEIDTFFDVPITPLIELFNQTIATGYSAEMQRLVGRVFDTPDVTQGGADEWTESDGHAPRELAVRSTRPVGCAPRLPQRLVGPHERRRLALVSGSSSRSRQRGRT